MSIIVKIYNIVGSLICHQLPSRSLTAGGITLPVCARDTGIYTGIFTSALILLLLRRFKAQKPPGLAPAVFMCVLMLPMIIDGMLSYAGITETNNAVRLFTGMLFGLPIPFFLVPAAHFNAFQVNEKAVLKNTGELLPAYAGAMAICILLLMDLVPYVVAGFIFIAGFLFLLSRIIYTILSRTGRFKGKALYSATCCSTLCILSLLYLISVYLLQPLKAVVLEGLGN